MMILLEHMKYFKWSAVSQSEFFGSDKLNFEMRKGSTKNSLVAFVNVEMEDPKDTKRIIRAAKSIDKIARELEVTNVILYPFAHLVAKNPAEPKQAIGTLMSLETELSKIKNSYKIISVPFGCSKMREGMVLGHERSVLLRSIRSG